MAAWVDRSCEEMVKCYGDELAAATVREREGGSTGEGEVRSDLPRLGFAGSGSHGWDGDWRARGSGVVGRVLGFAGLAADLF
jgi:hypothetical protein